jgi:histidine triad (HIT) family protein
MASIFSKIISGEIPSYKIAETENCYAFLDIMPLAEGHTLVIPKQEIDYIYDLEDELLIELQLFAKEVAIKLGKVMPCERIGTAVIGLEVPHAHIHLIPINNVQDINFARPKLKVEADRMAEIAAMIREA